MTEDKIKTAKECKEEEKATDEDMQAFVSHKLQQTPTGKCFLACIYEKNGSVCSFNVYFSIIFGFI